MIKSVALKLANVLGEIGIFRWLCPASVPVFMLHRVTVEEEPSGGKLPVSTLRKHLEYLKRNDYRVLSMDELWWAVSEGRALPDKSVVFTIDDGFSDHYELAASVFDEFGFVLNFFVITGFLDRQLWPWDDQISYGLNRTDRQNVELKLPSGDLYSIDLSSKTRNRSIRDLRNRLKRERQAEIYDWLESEFFRKLGVPVPDGIPAEYAPMSWDDARALVRAGHGVYPHTYSHRILASVGVEEQAFEISTSLERVEAELGGAAKVFAYPTGRKSDYDADSVARLKKSGIDMSFNTIPGYATKRCDPYEIPRFSLPGSHDQFKQIVNRFEAFKEKVRGFG